MPKYSPKNSLTKENEKKFRSVTLVITKNCNLKCSYCYEKHNLRDTSNMDLELAKKIISHYMTLEGNFERIIIDIFGGEPLLAYPLIKEIFEWCHEQKWERKYYFMLSTNGTLLNDEMKEWFASHREFLTIALSIDGNRTAHNINRNNSFDLIFQHLEFFKKNWPDQPAKMTISAETIPYVADSIIELEEMDLYFTANLPLENIWGSKKNKESLLEIYKAQLMRLVDYYVENYHLYPVYPILDIIPFYLGIPEFKMIKNNDCVRYCGAGHEMVAIDVDGSSYPCHRFLPWVSGKNAPTEPVNRQTNWEPQECNKCKIIHSCPTCAGYNWEVNGNTGIRTTYHCEAHKLEVLAASKIAAERLKKLQLSELNSLSPSLASALYENVRSLLYLIENGI